MGSSFGSDDVFMDISGIAKGDDFPRAIEQAIGEAKVILVVIGPEWNREDRLSAEHDWVGQEIALALKRRIPILPVLVNGATFPKKVPRPLRRLLNTNAIELRDTRWEVDVQQVATAVKIILSPDLAKQVRAHRKTFRIFVIHDLAISDGDRIWQERCRTILSGSLNRWSKTPLSVKVRFFSSADLLSSASETVPVERLRDTTARLLSYGMQLGDLNEGLSRNITPSDRWVHTARMLGIWLLDEKVRRRISTAFLKDVKSFGPVLIFAYSVGAVVAYEAFAREQDVVNNRVFVTFGSPLGIPEVRASFGGRIEELSGARLWLNFFNPIDTPFATRLRIKRYPSKNFTEFKISFPSRSADSEAVEEYLNHVRTRQDFWSFVTTIAPSERVKRSTPSELLFKGRPQRRRALLVGIGEYPDRDKRLLGCINDVYLMSTVLQEMGFESENIAVVMNQRATAVHLRERLQWLLDEAGDGDERIFYFSGHGATIPSLDTAETTNLTQEVLATYDFDWSAESSINDRFLAELYSQLPFSTRLILILDCGFPWIADQVSRRGTRGLNPPVDIQSMLRWDAMYQMWVAPSSTLHSGPDFSLGRGISVLPTKVRGRTFRAKQKLLERTYHHKGPYLPVVMAACSQRELCHEFRQGNIWYGVFTYAFAQSIRMFRYAGARDRATLKQLISRVHQRLMTLGVGQTPRLVGPSRVVDLPIL